MALSPIEKESSAMWFPTEFHPEFGFLAPSPQLRRLMRIALVAGVVGATLGGAAVLAVGRQSDVAEPGARVEPTLTVAQTSQDEIAPGSEFTLASNPVPEPAAAAKPCNEQTWPYLDRKCLTGITTRWRHVRVLPPDERAQAQPLKSAEMENEPSKPSEPSATPAKKRKSASRRSRCRSRDGDDLAGASDFAAARDVPELRRDRSDEDDRRGRRSGRDRRERQRDEGRRERQSPRNDSGDWAFFGR